MTTFAKDLRDAVYESVIYILSSKGIEDKICLGVADEVVDLFTKRVVIRQQNSIREEEVSFIKRAIIEADKKYPTGPN